jgi:hypothetical protein
MAMIDPKPAETPEATRTGDFSDVVIGAAVALIVFAIFGLYLWNYSATANPQWTLLLCGTIGAALGWCAGIMVSPYGSTERESFSAVGKLIYGFLSGYVVSKIDPLVNSLVGVPGNATSQINPVAIVGALIAVTCFAVAATLTYVSRSYWR